VNFFVYLQFFALVELLDVQAFVLCGADFVAVDLFEMFFVLVVQQVFFALVLEVLAELLEQDFVLLLPLVMFESATFEQFFVSFVFVFLPNIYSPLRRISTFLLCSKTANKYLIYVNKIW